MRAFYQRFYGLPAVTPQPKELAQATELLVAHGEMNAYALLDFSAQAARDTHYQPQTFGGILHYLPRVLAATAARATPATTPQAAAHAWTWQERYAQWRQRELTRVREALPPAERAMLEDQTRARLIAERTPAFALGLAVRVAVDEVLEARAALPSFEAWWQQQEA